MYKKKYGRRKRTFRRTYKKRKFSSRKKTRSYDGYHKEKFAISADISKQGADPLNTKVYVSMLDNASRTAGGFVCVQVAPDWLQISPLYVQMKLDRMVVRWKPVDQTNVGATKYIKHVDTASDINATTANYSRLDTVQELK